MGDFSLLRDLARKELVHLLEAAPGQKDLVIEPTLVRQLNRVAPYSLLTEHGVVKTQRLSAAQTWSEGVSRAVYLLRPSVANARLVVNHAKAWLAAGQKRHCTVVCVPRRLAVCEREFERNGLFELVDVHEFNPTFLELDSDLLSLELPDFFADAYLRGTQIWNHTAAFALWRLQSLYGPIGKIYGIGAAAERALKMMDTLFWEISEPRTGSDLVQPVSELFVVDRTLDLATPLLTCLTYEGLLDDTFGIDCGSVDLKQSGVLERLKQERPSAVVALSSADEVYALVRDRHIAAVGPLLGERAKRVKADFERSQSMHQVRDLKQFVGSELAGLKRQQQSIELHVCASEALLEANKGVDKRLQHEHALVSGAGLRQAVSYIEDELCQQLPALRTLSLMCLLSVTQGGLSAKEAQSLKAQFLHAHGYGHLLTLHNLAKVGLWTERLVSSAAATLNLASAAVGQLRGTGGGGGGATTFQSVAKRLALVPRAEVIERMNLKEPSDTSFVFNGAYTPAICKLIANALQFGFNREDATRAFGCPVVVKDGSKYDSRPPDRTSQRAIMVYFLGGVTYAEIAALRLLGRVRGVRTIIAATNITSRQKFLKTFVENDDGRTSDQSS